MLFIKCLFKCILSARSWLWGDWWNSSDRIYAFLLDFLCHIFFYYSYFFFPLLPTMSPYHLESSILPNGICLIFHANLVQLEKLGLQNVTFSCLRLVNDLLFSYLFIHPIWRKEIRVWIVLIKKLLSSLPFWLCNVRIGFVGERAR